LSGKKSLRARNNAWLFTVAYLLRRNKGNLESQKKRLLDYCAAKGYKVSRVITEVGSGINDTRKQWLSLLQDRMVRIIVVEHKDRFTRFGFTGYKTLLNTDGRDIGSSQRGGKWQGRPACRIWYPSLPPFVPGFTVRDVAKGKQRKSYRN